MPAMASYVRALLVAIVALGAPSAGADEASPWLWGAQLGVAQSDGRAAEPSGDLSTMSYDVTTTVGDKNRLGWRVFTGYRLNNYFALQLGYTDLGKAAERISRESQPFDMYDDVNRVRAPSARGLDFGAQLKVPVAERLALSVRGGAYRWKSHSSQQASDTFFGAGAEVSLMNDLSGTVEWVRYEVAGEPIALWTLGVLYRMTY